MKQIYSFVKWQVLMLLHTTKTLIFKAYHYFQDNLIITQLKINFTIVENYCLLW